MLSPYINHIVLDVWFHVVSLYCDIFQDIEFHKRFTPDGQLGLELGGSVDDEPDLTARLAAPNDEYCLVFLFDGL